MSYPERKEVRTLYKVLLVDDEVLVRVGMKALINWEEEGFKIVGEANNGEAALAQIKALEPDIVLTDVRMPVMDGLELIQKARVCGFTCKFIILSAYDDFQYVKQAFTGNARDYLLKLELEPDTLLQALHKVVLEFPCKAEEGFGPVPLHIKLKNVLNGDMSLFGELCDGSYRMGAVWADVSADAGESLVNMMEEVSANFGKSIWMWDKGGFCVGLLEWGNTIDIRQMWQVSDQMMRYAFNTDCYMGLSAVTEWGEDIRKARDEAVKTAESARFNECGLLEYNPTYIQEHSGTSFLHEEHFLKMEQAMKELELGTFVGELEQFEKIFRTEILSPAIAMKICNIIHFIMSKGMLQWGLYDSLGAQWNEVTAPMEKKSDYISWLGKIKRNTVFCGDECTDRFLVQVQLLLMPHMDERITLDYAAGKMGYSPSHFSRIFKQRAGMGFAAYVTRMKTEQAKRYLEQEEWKICDIASRIGYENASYFSRIFHQEVGMTPVEFRAAHQAGRQKES